MWAALLRGVRECKGCATSAWAHRLCGRQVLSPSANTLVCSYPRDGFTAGTRDGCNGKQPWCTHPERGCGCYTLMHTRMHIRMHTHGARAPSAGAAAKRTNAHTHAHTHARTHAHTWCAQPERGCGGCQVHTL